MKIEYDPEHDTLSIEFLDGVEVHDSLDRDGIIIDMAEDGRLVGIEILEATHRTAPGLLDQVGFSIVRERAAGV